MVEQIDRDAAASYYYSAGGSPNIANEIRDGKKDNWFRVKAFAAHRQAAEARLLARMREPDENMLAKCAAAMFEKGYSIDAMATAALSAAADAMEVGDAG